MIPAPDAAASLNVPEIAMGLLGGLALFLFGLEQMASALKAVAGDRLKDILSRLTTNRFRGAFTGALVTAVIQSSSVTTVLVVGFISAGLLTLTQSVGIIIGAKIGTTVTAQIIAFQVTQYALLMIAAGFSLLFFTRREQARHYGAMIMGLGLVFFGMALMAEATEPLRDYPPFINAMVSMQHPLLGILVGAAFTAIVQSSSATIGIVIVLAGRGYISLEAGIALSLGANIGTCVTAMFAAIGKPREAVRAAVVHVCVSVLGVVLWVGFIDFLAQLATSVSPAAAADLAGDARRAAETPRQIANAFTIFNVMNAMVFIWFTGPFAALARRIVPERPPPPESASVQPMYLDGTVLETPAVALEGARKEIVRLGELVRAMLIDMRRAAYTGDRTEVDALVRADDDIDTLHRAIVKYLGEIGRTDLTSSQTRDLLMLMSIANKFEGIGDTIETRVVAAARRRLRSDVIISDQTLAHLLPLHDQVVELFDVMLDAVRRHDAETADQCLERSRDVHRALNDAFHHIAHRLAANAPNRLEAYTVESELIEHLKQVFYFVQRIARSLREIHETAPH